MKKDSFNYYLPKELIAQQPKEKRDSSRLLYMDKKSGVLQDSYFYNICDYLKSGDCLILNDSRVLPARLYGIRVNSGAQVEFLLLKKLASNTIWEALTGPGKKAKIGNTFVFNNLLEAEIIDVLDNGNRIIKFNCHEKMFYDILFRIGQMPLPHYINAPIKNQERYQTIYSKKLGSSAAPTAGLHFTKELLNKVEKKGVKIGYITLHVGLGTFRPVKTENIEDHRMHSEHYQINQTTADLINQTKRNGGRVVSVGTTSCRTLESAADASGIINACEGDTDIFIYPSYDFKIIDGLITNFHLPESTLIMLVAAFAGYENTMDAYKFAVANKYRFFSFGDAMIII